MRSTPAAPLRFGRFELQAEERRLLVDGRPAPVGARAFDLLLALAERPGRLVDKGTLMDAVWPGLVVQDNNLAAQVSALRKLFGDDEVIATIPGRGYRFVARIERDVQAAASADVTAASRLSALRTNLPGELPALLGRHDELSSLRALVARHRLVSVVGAGGIGKSLLTQHLLAAQRTDYAHGVCFVELASLTDAHALPGAVAAALGVHGGPGDAQAALLAAAAPLTLLLALDNAEHLLDAVAALCRALHDAAPGLRLVVTSQAPLRLAAEQVLRIGPLAVPERDATPAADALGYGAVALLAERARVVNRHFALRTDGDATAAIQVCRALDGLPLAIELAAARAPLLGLAPLRDSLQHRFALLTRTRNRAAPARQRTLRAALEWSHALLEPREQRAFRRLGVIAGSASLGLIERLLTGHADDRLDRWAVLDALDVLVDRSLVALVDGAAAAEPRYRLLETPRAYALERLEEAGERAALQQRHAQALGALFDAAYEQYFSGGVGVEHWLHACESDLDNAREAVHWAFAAGDDALALRVASTMLRALPPSRHLERIALADLCEPRIDASMPEPLQCRMWLELNCTLADTQKQRARHAAERALALARRLDATEPDRFLLCHALGRAASGAAQTGDLAAARVLLVELRPLEDPAWPAQRLLWGVEAAQWVARMAGDTAQALRQGRRLLELDRERGSQAAIATGNLIDAELAAGHAASAASLGGELEASLRGTRHEFSLAFARINLLAAQLAQDDVAAARPVARAAWAQAAAFDLQHAAAAYLALLCALERRAGAALQLVAWSEALYAERGEAREQNETEATERARTLALAQVEPDEAARLHAAGAALREADVAALAFG